MERGPKPRWAAQMAALLNDEKCAALGLCQTGFVPTREIPFSPEIRAICAGNACRLYGTSWACPPAVGDFEACRAACLRYAQALVFSACAPLEDSFDFEGMAAGLREFKVVCDRLADAVRGILPDFLLLSNEGCGRCAVCTYPDAPCRFPDRLYPAVEGYGIEVGPLAARAGVRYNNGPNTVTFLGGLLFGEI